MSKLNLSILVISLSLTSCAGLYKDWAAQNCNYNSAYENGNNDREEDEKMDSGMYAAQCSGKAREAALKGYRDGYEKARQSENTAPESTHIQIGGTSINIPGKKNPKAFYCTIEAFGKAYNAFGATKLEAKTSAFDECKKNNHPMHCEGAVCKVNK
ncbi:MAG: hypothetical protein ACOYL6_16570 [Bacteriovoracaceae bacterium]